MSVLVFGEAINNKYKKVTFEAVNYGAQLAKSVGGECVVVTNGSADVAAELGNYGAQKVLHFDSDKMHDTQFVTEVVAKAFGQSGSKVCLLADNSKGKALVGRLAVKLNAGAVSSVSAMADTSAGFKVSRGVFSGKAEATFNIDSNNKIITVARNAIGLEESAGTASMEALDVSGINASTELIETNRVEGTVPLPEAELVVSAGRGMKGPENWGIIDELANLIGATTACSRPVADTGWRPHHEHVGQTGIAIKPNLYIAIGISGAIQHLAGVNSSKTIVVINKDSEAPFFKAADYGVVGDLFDVVPRLIESIKKFKTA